MLRNAWLVGLQGPQALSRAFASLALTQQTSPLPGLDEIVLSRAFPSIYLPPADVAAPSLSYVRGRMDRSLLEETLGQNLEFAAAMWGEHEAVVSVHQGLRLTYRELQRAADLVARGLLALGVQRRDRVAIWSPNSAEWIILQFAAAQVGAILVNLNPALRSTELTYAMNRCSVSHLVMAPECKSTSYVDMVERLQAEGQLPSLRHKVVLGPDRPTGGLTWDDLAWAGSGAGLATALELRKAELRPGQAVNIQFTSGTTGFPKAAVLSHRNILNNGYFIGEGCHYTSADRIAIPVPLFHCFGSVLGTMAAITHGSVVVLPSGTFEAEAALRAVEQERCTSLYGVPAMFVSELEHSSFGRYHLDSLRTGIMAGSPCPVEVMRRVQRDMHMSEVTVCYGMTETSPVSFQSSIDDPVERRVSTVGRVHPHLEAKVVDPVTGSVLPQGAVGELCVRGYSTFLGYWGDLPATMASVDQAGWMHTGDLAAIDTEGFCNIAGRQKDMVIRGGENIYPREVEEFLHRHPSVAEVQVFGVPDLKYGEELCAWVRLRDGAQHRGVGESELRAFFKGRISHYKVPRYWKIVASFPMTASGKPQKFKMREVAIHELGLEAAAAVKTA